MTQQFDNVASKYGAPMGRRPHGSPEGKIEVFRVRMVDGDYDDGGAYWGGPPSAPLYCARNDEGSYLDFARAHSKSEAIAALNIEDLV